MKTLREVWLRLLRDVGHASPIISLHPQISEFSIADKLFRANIVFMYTHLIERSARRHDDRPRQERTGVRPCVEGCCFFI